MHDKSSYKHFKWHQIEMNKILSCIWLNNTLNTFCHLLPSKMFHSSPAPFQRAHNCQSNATHSWCNKRGHGFTTFEHSHDSNVNTHPTHRLQPLPNQRRKCTQLNKHAVSPPLAPQMQSIMKASCAHVATAKRKPNTCVSAATNLQQQQRMFANIKYDCQ